MTDVADLPDLPDLPALLEAAFKAERAAARKLVRSGAAADQASALRLTLERSAAPGALAQLLAERRQLRQADAARSAARTAARNAAMAARAARHAGPASAWRGWFDGSALPNPGRCGIGALLLGPDGERIEVARGAGYGNSSEAEYRALIALLDAACAAGARDLTIYGDSQVVINDMHHDAGSPLLAELRGAASALLAALGNVTLRWIPRHKNGEADALSQRAVRSMPD